MRARIKLGTRPIPSVRQKVRTFRPLPERTRVAHARASSRPGTSATSAICRSCCICRVPLIWVAADLGWEVLRWSPDDKQRIGEPVQQFASDTPKNFCQRIGWTVWWLCWLCYPVDTIVLQSNSYCPAISSR